MPRAETGGRGAVLLLPHFSGITLESTVPAGSWLEIRSIESFGPAWMTESGYLRIVISHVDASAESRQVIVPDDEFGTSGRWPLGGAGTLEIRLEALLERPRVTPEELEAHGATETDAGIMLVRPRITANSIPE